MDTIIVEVRIDAEDDNNLVSLEKKIRDYINKNIPILNNWEEIDLDFDDNECRIVFEVTTDKE